MLDQDRDTKERLGNRATPGVAAGKLIYAGALVCLTAAGYATPGAASAVLIALGRASEQIDNTNGADGDVNVNVDRGIFRWDNSSSADEITDANIGQPCFVVDDATVALTDGGGTRSFAGKIFDVDDEGVWVDMRENVSGNKVYIELQAADLVAADASVYYAPAPIAGRITKIWSALSGHVVAAGDATLTGKINGVAITTGVVTHALAGTAVGEVKSATPTAANACNAGDAISFTVGGANTNNVAAARVVVEISP